MDNKRLGGVLLALSFILVVIFVIVVNSLNKDIAALGCYQDPGCKRLETSLSIVHFAFGIFGFLLALGFYLLFFSRGEEAIVKRLEEDTRKRLTEEKYSILLKGLDDFEKKVITSVREQDGITQNTLALRVDMSKAKLSQVLANLEKKGLVRRVPEKKTLAVYLREEL